jgi:steroid 5-alpha reductase family enzyme
VALAYAAGGLGAWAVGLLLPGRHPVLVGLLADVAATLVVFAFSAALSNSSVYDPYWSLAPIVLVGYWWLQTGARFELPALAALALVAWWGLRLTWNWVRRWNGLTDEDWRYVQMRERYGRFYWPVSLAGIHLVPTLLVFAGCLPLYPLLTDPPARGGWATLAGLSFTAAAVTLETSADRQLWRWRASGRRGALRSGLWGRCRHPNYLGEILFWWGLFLSGVATEPAWWPAVAGPLAITALFLGVSIPWKDRRMRERHPGSENLPAMIPRLRSPG